jgi:PAS domain S-box-containing protein
MKTTSIHVLIAEDDAAHANAIRRAFEADGTKTVVKVVGTLREFRQRSVEWPLNIAVMDLNLPDGRAVEVLTSPPEAGPFPVLVMTSYGNEQVAVEAIKSGALDYVVKSPEAFADMPHIVARALNEWNLLQERKRAEAALELKNVILSTQQETSLDGILVVDANGEIISFNRRFVEIWGIPSDVAESKSDEQVLQSVMDKLAAPGEFVSKLEQLHEAHDETSRDEIALKDGRTCDRYSAPMIGATGQYLGRVWYFRDITQRRQAEQALRESEERLRITLETTKIGSWDWDVKKDVYYISPTYFTMLGYEPNSGSVDREKWLQRIHPDDRAATVAKIQGVLNGTSSDYQYEHRIKHADGSYRWHSVIGYKIESDETGKPVRLIGVRMDITGRKLAEEKLLAEERQYQALAEISPVGIFQADALGQTIYVNPRWCQIAGLSAKDALGEGWLRAVHPQDREQISRGWHEAVHAPHISTADYRFVHPDGTVVWVMGQAVPERDHAGLVVGYVGTITDVTEKKIMESRLLRSQRLESVGRLASGIAHDLNNILAPMLMSAPMLREAISDPDIRQLVDTIESSAVRGAGVIKQLLTFSRGVEGERVPVQLKSLVLDMLNIVRETFPKNVVAAKETPANAWLVRGDATQIHQILMNLCVNARDAMPDGGKLTLELENVEVNEAIASLNPGASPGRYVALSVTDTGTGISPENLDKIFDPFFTTKEVGKGTGLGLSTVIGIIKSHGGFVQVNSRLGQGTQFKVYLPACETPKDSEKKRKPDPLAQGQGELILLVDDEESIRRVARQTLERHGYRMLEASDGTQGLAQYTLHQSEVRLVITDLAMPFMDGLAFIHALRQINPQVRIIAMSGHQSKAAVGNLPPDLVQVLLTKPFNAAELLQSLKQALHP